MAERVRTRSTGGGTLVTIGPSYVTGTLEHGYSALPNPPTYGSTLDGWSTQTTTDWSSGNYPKRIKAGEVLNNPFHSILVKETPRKVGTYEHVYRNPNTSLCYSHTPAQSHYTYHKYVGQNAILGSTTGGGYLSLSDRASRRQAVIDLAVTEAFANIDISSMQALVTVAESGKTIDSMRAILYRAYKILRNVRKLNLSGVLKELSPAELADRYMEARYAIRPLMIDARNIVGALQRERRHIRKTFIGVAADSVTSTATVTNVGSIYLTEIDISKQLAYTVSARAGVLCDVDIAASTIMGLDQIAESLWELVPFSFIVDWFTNVGDLIAAYTPNAGVNQLASWVSVREELTLTNQVIAHRSIANTAGYVNVSITSPGGFMQKTELVRERIVNPLLSPFPRFDINLDGYKITDLGIILKNVLR